MTPNRIAAANPAWGSSADHGDEPRDDGPAGGPGAGAADAAAAPLSPDVVRRFHALIDEVTDQLMFGSHHDRGTCRADAIALLIATSGHVDEPANDDAESPLMYLLLEEQCKAAAALGRAPADRRAAFLKV
jgi:hypothetical protein